MIVHSVLQDGPGFPFLAPCIYKYICTESVDEAIELVEMTDLPVPFAEFMSKVMVFVTYNLWYTHAQISIILGFMLIYNRVGSKC